MIEIIQGQTIKLELTIVDDEGNLVSLPDTDAVFAYSRGSSTVEVVGTITDSVFEAVLDYSDTKDLLGKYKVEVKVKDNVNDEIAPILVDEMIVEKSIIPDFGID